MNVFLRLSFVSVQTWILRPLLSLQYLNSAGINLNWTRTNLRKKEKQLSSQYDILFSTSHNILERYYFCTRKHIEVGLNFSLAAGSKMLCICFYVFSKCPGIFFPWTDLDNRQRNTYLPGGMFFYVFMYLTLPIWTGLVLKAAKRGVFPQGVSCNILSFLAR